MVVPKEQITSVSQIATTKQVAKVTGTSTQNVHNCCYKVKRDGETILDICYPFPHADSSPESGPLFIVKNDKYKKFISK